MSAPTPTRVRVTIEHNGRAIILDECVVLERNVKSQNATGKVGVDLRFQGRMDTSDMQALSSLLFPVK